MKRIWIFAATLVLLSHAVPAQAQTQTWFGFQVGVSGGSAPPPPVVFRSEPHIIVVNDVQVVDDERCSDDVFRTENTWWRMRGGFWYRSASWRGPWSSVDVRRVPDRVLVLPARTWKHPPRQDTNMAMMARHRNRERERHCERDRERHSEREQEHGHRHHDHDGHEGHSDD
jgi:hypothetical protein